MTETTPLPDPAAEAKARTVAVFDRSSATYDAVGVDFFSTFGERLVELAAPAEGSRVLDVGCGRGAVLWPAADAVGPSGSILAIDLAPGMVERTAADALARGLAHVRVELGDAEAPGARPESFDVVLVGFVIFFLPDHGAALDAYREALVPGGTLAMTTFGPEDERFATVFAAAAAHIAAPEGEQAQGRTPARAQDGPFATSGSITALLDRHGFTHIEHVEQAYDVEFDDAEQWIAWSWSHGARQLWEAVPDERRVAAQADAVAALEALAPPSGPLTHRWVVRYTTAKRPE
jgi:ubiquinone/menaquinone biosynthesis C-methylase UbiE